MDRVRVSAAVIEAIDGWLRSESGLVLGTPQGNGSWELRADHALLPDRRVRLVLPPGFPSEPPDVFVHKGLCLAVPHVETSGKVCLGLEAQPRDHADPVAAVKRALESLQALLTRSLDATWCREEFARESLSYWEAHCSVGRRTSGSRNGLFSIEVDATGLDRYAEGQFGLWLEGRGRDRRAVSAMSVLGDTDPRTLASRHQHAAGTFIAGRALFIRVPLSVPWIPGNWPQSLDELNASIREWTSGAVQLPAWLTRAHRREDLPCALVFVHGSAAYGYIRTTAFMKGVGVPGLYPVVVSRIDADWALARDQRLEDLHHRRMRKIVVLGIGSLGAPLAEHLARSGVGHLTLVDDERFQVENTSRHMLGFTSVGRSKAEALARRLQSEIPGVSVTAANTSAAVFLERDVRPGAFDLIVDCTAESSVRALLSVHRFDRFDRVPIVMAWVEPFCAATHVVALDATSKWPIRDPADDVINVAQWPDHTRVVVPRCAGGFHPYGSADIGQSAGFAAERILAVLDGHADLPNVWTRSRSREFFDSLPVVSVPRPLVPAMGTRFGSIEIERGFHDLVGHDVP